MDNGIELLTLHERRGPSGNPCLMGFFGSIAVTVAKDEAKPGTWRLSIHDLARAGCRDEPAPRARAISAPDSDGWYSSDLDDSIPEDITIGKDD